MAFKRVRLPNGKFITRIIPESTPLRLQGFKPDEVWVMEGERKIVIYDMETKHLLNAIKFVEAKAKNMLAGASMGDKFEPRVFAMKAMVDEYPAYPNMVKELTRRLNGEKTHEEKTGHERELELE